MIWLSHKKYTEQYLSTQFKTFCEKVRRETRNMVLVASVAVAVMAAVEMGYLYELLKV